MKLLLLLSSLGAAAATGVKMEDPTVGQRLRGRVTPKTEPGACTYVNIMAKCVSSSASSRLATGC